MPISTRRDTTFSIYSPVARSSITTTMASHPRRHSGAELVYRCRFCFVVHHAALEPARFVDDPLEQPGDCLGSERAFRRDAPDVQQHFLFAIGLVDLEPLLLLQP